ncbi:Transposon Ty3-I Gag-Pol polyprotein [Folsomia candida]|uniref:RNA-directed DNA polymerase n=1 Tax=Folsomia candida TaxID=158441 RepID=A0A226DCR7_FOLCA|nr:Transposon Ty3-I Gag-Pol polyprotein [Folsomia candida]
MAFNLMAKGVVAMVGIVIAIPPVLATAAITAAVTTLLVTTAVAMTTVPTLAEMTPPTISVAIQTFSHAAVMNLPVAVTTSIIILRIVTTRDAKTISGMSVQRVPLPPLKSILRPSSPSLDPAGPRHVTFNQNTIDLRINLQDFSANHGPVTIDTFINNQRITATVDNGAKASIITEALAVGLPRINPNLPYRLSDFGNHTIRDCGLVILPLKIGTQQVTYPLFVVPSSPCPLLLGHDFHEHFLLSSNESFRCLMSPILGSVPGSSSPAASGPSPPPPPPLPSALLSAPPAALSPPPVAAAELSPPPFLMDLTNLKINPNISPSTRAKLLSLITEFKHIFSWDPTKLGRTDRVEFDIDTGDHPPIRMQQFSHPEKIHRDIKSHVDKLLAQGIVRPIRGSWSSPCFFVPKKDDDGNLTSQRFTVDYRSLSRITKKIQWPQTRIDDIFQSLRGKKYFTSLDFTSGYYQVPMTEAQEKATFVTREGTFAPTVLPFGVSNGPARFAELLDEVLYGLKGEVCQNFFDDIVSAGATEEEALEKLRLIFERIAAEGLTLKPYKCDFLQDEINLLGFSLSAMGTKPDEKKLRGVSQLKPPTTGHKVKKLVAFFSYFRKYIPSFSRIVHPLQCLSTIRGKITWTKEHQAAFDTVIARLLSRPVLRLFDPALPTLLETDASSYGLEAGLFQFYEGEKHPVAFISRTLSVAEKRYPSVMLELTAICWALKRLRPLIYGVPLSIATDCHGICWLLQGSKQELNSRLSSMVVCLMDYTIVEIRHVSGKKHECADFLSRYPTEDFQPNRDELDDLPILTIGSLNLMSSQGDDPELAIIINKLKLGQDTKINEHFTLKDDVLFKRDNQYNRLTLVIPSKLIPSVLDECHDSPFSGHMGFTKTYDRIKQRYWFPGMRRQIMRYVATCSKCQFRKSPRSKPNGLFQCIKVPKNAFQRVQIDVAGPFPASKSNKKYIITASCYLTKWLETEATHSLALRLLPIFPSPSSTRHRRSIEIIGDFYNWCCGVAQQKTVDRMQLNEHHLDNFTLQLQSALTAEHSFTVESTKIFNKDFQALEKALSETDRVVHNELRDIANEEETLESKAQDDHHSLFALAVAQFQTVLNQNWIQTLSDRRQELSIPSSDLEDVFRYPLATCLFSPNKVVATVRIPLVSLNTTYEMKRIQPLPFLFNDDVCQVKIDVNYVALPKHRIIPITPTISLNCDPTTNALCLLPRFDPPVISFVVPLTGSETVGG